MYLIISFVFCFPFSSFLFFSFSQLQRVYMTFQSCGISGKWQKKGNTVKSDPNCGVWTRIWHLGMGANVGI